MNKRMFAAFLVAVVLLVALTSGLSLAQERAQDLSSDPGAVILPAPGEGERDSSPEEAPAAGPVAPTGAAEGSDPHGPVTYDATGLEEIEPGAEAASTNPTGHQNSDPLPP